MGIILNNSAIVCELQRSAVKSLLSGHLSYGHLYYQDTIWCHLPPTYTYSMVAAALIGIKNLGTIEENGEQRSKEQKSHYILLCYFCIMIVAF